MLNITLLLSAGLTAGAIPQEPAFEAPVRVKAGGAFIQLEAPGFAAPCFADVDGDGHKDLLVGQFKGGKIRYFRGTKDGSFEAGTFLQAGGEVAAVPGVS